MIDSDLIKVFAFQTQKRMDADLLDELSNKIDKNKRERINKFYHWQDVQRTLVAELLVRAVIINATGLQNKAISFSISDFGKPVLTNFPQLHFNTSHSGDWIVCALHNKQVGIDVEKITAIDFSISENFFYSAEHHDIINSVNPLHRFFDYWTLKESYIKFIGKGLSHPLNTFSIRLHEAENIRMEVDSKPIQEVYFKQYLIDEGYKMAVCAAENKFDDKLNIYTIADIIKSIN